MANLAVTATRVATHEDEVASFLHRAPSIFLSCARDGTQTLADFKAKWSTVRQGLLTTQRYQGLSTEISCLAHATARCITALTEGLISLDVNEENGSTRLVEDLQTVFDQPCLNASSYLGGARAHSLMLENGEDSINVRAIGLSWLLSNLHNPYPSNTVKAVLAKQAYVSPQTMNSWFANMRRRIGWTALAKKHFYGDRAATIDVAHRVFVQPGPTQPVPKTIKDAFMVMKRTAEKWYAKTVQARDIIEDLDCKHDRLDGQSTQIALNKPNMRQREIERGIHSSRSHALQPFQRSPCRDLQTQEAMVVYGAHSMNDSEDRTQYSNVSPQVVPRKRRSLVPFVGSAKPAVTESPRSESRPRKRTRTIPFDTSSPATHNLNIHNAGLFHAHHLLPPCTMCPIDLANECLRPQEWDNISVKDGDVAPEASSRKRRLDLDDLQNPSPKRARGICSLADYDVSDWTQPLEGLEDFGADVKALLHDFDFAVPQIPTTETQLSRCSLEVHLFKDWTTLCDCSFSELLPSRSSPCEVGLLAS